MSHAEHDSSFAAELDRIVAELMLELSPAALAKMRLHYWLLRSWNERVNLTRIVEPLEAARRHFGESLFLMREAGLEHGTVADLGSGGGFPGLPLAACRDDLHLTAVESVGKKAVFLREASRGWGNVSVVEQRIEELNVRFEYVVARAVALEPLMPVLSRIADRAAVLVGREGAKVFDSAEGWRVVQRSALPWSGAGWLVIAESC